MSKKKLLITGASGFIGSHLAELCVELGFNVVAFDRYNSNSHSGWLEDSKYRNHMDIILGDVRDYDSVYKVMKGCGSVFHLAALIWYPLFIHFTTGVYQNKCRGYIQCTRVSKKSEIRTDINHLDQ